MKFTKNHTPAIVICKYAFSCTEVSADNDRHKIL